MIASLKFALSPIEPGDHTWPDTAHPKRRLHFQHGLAMLGFVKRLSSELRDPYTLTNSQICFKSGHKCAGLQLIRDAAIIDTFWVITSNCKCLVRVVSI
jgi:hypothetical protein